MFECVLCEKHTATTRYNHAGQLASAQSQHGGWLRHLFGNLHAFGVTSTAAVTLLPLLLHVHMCVFLPTPPILPHYR